MTGLALFGACGGGNSEVQPTGSGGTHGPGGTGGSSAGGTGGGDAGTGGSAAPGGTGGSSTTGGTGGSSTTGGTGGSSATGTGGTGGALTTGTGGTGSGGCPARATFTIANHDTLNVTWPAGLATMGGSAAVHLWTKVTFAATSSGGLNATAQACGSNLPPTMLTALAGSGSFEMEIPNATWDSPTMPKFMFPASQTGWDAGSKITYSSNALVGFNTDPGATWPTANTAITGISDPDGDGSPALTTVPKTGSGFVAPPTSILQITRVDKVYIVTRNTNTVTITRTACDQVSTATTYTHFDNHVVGCHVMGGSECTASEVSFVDTNRTIYQTSSVTVQSKVVPDDISCTDIRAALPM